MSKRFFQQLWTIGDALSQLGNAVFLGSKNANESISGRAYRVSQLDNSDNKAWLYTYKVINFLFFFTDDHCAESHLADLVRARELLGAYKTK